MADAKKAVRSLRIFLSIMLFLTFFSRTLYQATLPQVTAVSISGGYLTLNIPVQNPLINSELTIDYVLCAENLSSPLKVKRIYGQINQMYEKDSALVEFDSYRGAYALKQAEIEYEEAETALKLWRQSFDQRIRDIQKRTDELHSAGEASMEEIRMLNEERKLMEQDGIHNGSSLTTLETRYNEAKRICNVLSELSEDEWILNAPDKLWLTSLNVEKEGEYWGIEPVFSYVPDGGDLYVGVSTCLSEEMIKAAEQIVMYDGRGKRSAAWAFDHMEQIGENCLLWAVSVGENAELPENDLYFRLETGYYDSLVPLDAVFGEQIYLVKERDGSWGQTEQYVCRVDGKRIIEDDQYVLFETAEPIRDAMVVVDWDRPFEDGDAVVLKER